MGKRKSAPVRRLLPAALALCAVLAAFCLGVGRAAESDGAEEKRLAEESVRRAAVSCYAIEGFYPDSYEYLRDNYHVRVDESKYVVEYSVFASNLMPDITILEVDR
jgi:hypothetical protein